MRKVGLITAVAVLGIGSALPAARANDPGEVTPKTAGITPYKATIQSVKTLGPFDVVYAGQVMEVKGYPTYRTGNYALFNVSCETAAVPQSTIPERVWLSCYLINTRTSERFSTGGFNLDGRFTAEAETMHEVYMGTDPRTGEPDRYAFCMAPWIEYVTDGHTTLTEEICEPVLR